MLIAIGMNVLFGGLIYLATRGPAARRRNPMAGVDAAGAIRAIVVALSGVAITALIFAALIGPGGSDPADGADGAAHDRGPSRHPALPRRR